MILLQWEIKENIVRDCCLLVDHVRNRRHKLKEMAVAYKGGACERCGYNKVNSALDFHHLDPSRKDFSISQKGHTMAWSKMQSELDKCILVCKNCHAEIHATEYANFL